MHGISDDPKSQRSNYYKNSLIRKKKVWQGHEKSFLPSIKRRPSLPIMQSFALLILKVTKIDSYQHWKHLWLPWFWPFFQIKAKQGQETKCRKASLSGLEPRTPFFSLTQCHTFLGREIPKGIVSSKEKVYDLRLLFCNNALTTSGWAVKAFSAFLTRGIFLKNPPTFCWLFWSSDFLLKVRVGRIFKNFA